MAATAFNLRSSTHNDPYAVLEFTCVTARTAGDIIRKEDIVGVVVNTVAVGGTVVLVYQAAKIYVPCQLVTTGNLANMVTGCTLYHDATDNNVNTDTNNRLCGIVTDDASLADTSVEMHLMGALGIVS